MTCWVHKIARRPYCRWRACPITDAEFEQVYVANTLFDGHCDNLEFGYRFLTDGARDARFWACDRTM